MISNQQQIFDKVVFQAIKTALSISHLAGSADVVIAKAELPLIIIDVTDGRRQLVPIRIRDDQDTLGWLYTQPPSTNVVFVRNNTFLYSITLDDFKIYIEKLITAEGKAYTATPTAGKMCKQDGAITFWLDKEPLFVQPSAR